MTMPPHPVLITCPLCQAMATLHVESSRPCARPSLPEQAWDCPTCGHVNIVTLHALIRTVSPEAWPLVGHVQDEAAEWHPIEVSSRF